MKRLITLQERTKLKGDFLDRSIVVEERFKSFTKDEPIGVIYVIKNKLDGKVYVGKTTNIEHRASNYIREYVIGNSDRKINKALLENGIDNFKMYPIAEYSNDDEGMLKEIFFIKHYNAIDNGYNLVYESTHPKYKGNNKSIPHTPETKLSKSKYIAAINPDTNKVVFASGMKLFGDWLGHGKDVIKNKAKEQNKIKGYYIIYLNNDDRKTQRDKNSVRYLNYQHMKLSLIGRVDEFDRCCNVIEAMISDKCEDISKYEILCIVQDGSGVKETKWDIFKQLL